MDHAMGQRTLPPPRLATLPPATTPDLKAQFDASQKAHGLRTGIPC
jgi:hypothetical protein